MVSLAFNNRSLTESHGRWTSIPIEGYLYFDSNDKLNSIIMELVSYYDIAAIYGT